MVPLKKAIQLMQNNETVVVYLSDIDDYKEAKIVSVYADTGEVEIDYPPSTVVGLHDVHEGTIDEVILQFDSNIDMYQHVDEDLLYVDENRDYQPEYDNGE